MKMFRSAIMCENALDESTFVLNIASECVNKEYPDMKALLLDH